VKKHYIHKLIEEGEHQQQDFKFAITDAKKIARSLTAFANTDGGRLLIGVKDNGVIAGVRSEEELHMIDAAMQMYTRPKIRCKAKTWIVEGKTVVEVIVEKGNNKPYSAPNENGKWTVYIRQNDNNILANKLLVKSWRKKKSPLGMFIELEREHNILIDYLKEHEHITISKFCRKASINLKHAEDIIVDLLTIDLIDYENVDTKTVYSLKRTNNES
jgi:predicted HTH transcriptional regulator